MITKVSVARVSCQVWGASTDRTEVKAAEMDCLPGFRHGFTPILPLPCGISSSDAKAARRSCSGSWIWTLRWSGNQQG